MLLAGAGVEPCAAEQLLCLVERET